MTNVLLVLLTAMAAHSPPDSVQSECLVRGGGTPQQQARALDVCKRAHSRIAELFGMNDAVVELVLQPAVAAVDFEISSGRVVGFVPTGDGARPAFESFDAWERIAAHEIAHNIFASRIGVPHRYGTNLGDWFMEAVAIWAETDAERLYRIKRAAATGRAEIALPELLRMHHPNFLTRENSRGVRTLITSICREPCPGRPDTLHIYITDLADGTKRTDTLPPGSPRLRNRDVTVAFYELSISVLEFIHERGGPAAVRLLEQRIRDGLGADAVLNLPGLPAALPEFEQAWSEWLTRAAQRDYPGSPTGGALTGEGLGKRLAAAEQRV